MTHSLRGYGNGIGFQVVSGQSPRLEHIWSNSWCLLVARASLSKVGFQLEGFWEVGRTRGLVLLPSLWPLPNSPGEFSVAAPCSGPLLAR